MTLEILRVYYTNKMPGSEFLYISVENVRDAKIVINALAERDLYSDETAFNMIGLERLDEEANEWQDWKDEQGREIDEVMREEQIN